MGYRDGVKYASGSLEQQRIWQAAYREIVRQAMAKAHGTGEAPFVGTPMPRNDVLYKVLGQAEYADDIYPEGALHGRFVRSQHPRAKITRVDVTAARAVPGVVDVLTANDIDPEHSLVGTLEYDTPVLAKDEVRYVGEPIVAIAAESLAVADAACELVEIDYEVLEPVLEPERALAPDAPRVDPQGNIIADFARELGDVEAGFAAADVVLERTFECAPVDHCFLEPQAGVAFVDDDGVLTLLVCTQHPHYHHQELERLTGLPTDKIKVIQTVTGGGFGGKLDVTIECVACLFALRTKRPVKMVLSREEVFVATTKRHQMRVREKLGATRDGKLIACEIDVLADGGAYRSYSRIVAGRILVHAGMPYDIPNLRVRLKTTFTNHPPSGAMRSFGVVKIAFANESLVNEMAAELGMSPIEIRRLNGFKEGSKTSTGQVLHDVGFPKTLDTIEAIYEERKRTAARSRNGRKIGWGIASVAYGIGYTGIPNPAVFTMRAAPDGSITAFVGTPDFGTGSDTAFSQIIADATGLDLSRIQIRSGDSSRSLDAGPTSASRLTYFCGNAGYLCGKDFKDKFEAAFAEKLASPRDAVMLKNDGVQFGNERMSFEDACALLTDELAGIEGYGKFDPETGVNLETFTGNPYPTYTYATHLVEVEVDEELGSVRPLRYWAAQDAGVIVNPPAAEGQIEGGVVMGLGMALWEKVARQGGHTLNPHYRDYLLAGSRDAPEITAIFVENHDRTGPFGAKGFAESTLVPTPAAVAAAIYDAVGVRPTRLPMESEAILELIRGRARRAAE